jgi:hypothetical protein
MGQGQTAIRQNLTATEAQAIKQGTYRQLAKKYGQLSNADVEEQKALARSLKEDRSITFHNCKR